MNKSRKRQARDEAVNAMADAKSSNPEVRKDGRYEAKKSERTIAGGAPMKTGLYNVNKGYESNAQEKKNLGKMPGAFKQMSQSGTFLTKHMSTSMEMGGSKSAMLQTKQGYNDRLDETLGSKDGKEAEMTQSMKARRDESKGAEKKLKQGPYSSNTKMS